MFVWMESHQVYSKQRKRCGTFHFTFLRTRMSYVSNSVPWNTQFSSRYFECCSLYRIRHNETWNLAIFQCARAEWIQYTQIMWRNGFQQVSIFQPTICAHLIYVHHDLHRTWNSCIMFRVHRILWQILLKSWKVNQKFATRLVDNG